MGSAWWLWLGFVVHGRPFQLIVIWVFNRNLLPTTAPERGVAELAPGHPLARVRVEHGFELHPALAAQRGWMRVLRELLRRSREEKLHPVDWDDHDDETGMQAVRCFQLRVPVHCGGTMSSSQEDEQQSN